MSRGTLRYSGFLGYWRGMKRNEGWFSYWRGNGASIWRTFGNGILRLTLFNAVKTGLFGSPQPDKDGPKPENFLPDDMDLLPDVHVCY